MSKNAVDEIDVADVETSEQQQTLFRWSPLDLPLFFFLLSALIGVWAAYDRSLSWGLLGMLGGSLAIYGLLAWPAWGAENLYRLAWLLLVIQSLLALYFVAQFNDFDYPVKVGFVSRLGRLTGRLVPPLADFYPQPNALAAFIEGGIPLAFGLAVAGRSRWQRMVALLLLGLSGYGMLLTVSRGAWLALAACGGLGLMLWMARSFPPRVRLTVGSVLGIVALLAGVILLQANPAQIPGLDAVLNRATDRLELYRNSLDLVRDYPLSGIGLGDTFAFVYSRYILLIPHAYLTYAHMLPLAIWLNQGLLGLISFGWTLVVFYALTWRQFRHSRGDGLFWGATAGVTVMLLHGLTDAPQYASYWVMPVFYALLGLALARLRVQDPAARQPRPVAVAGLVTLVLLGAFVFVRSEILYSNLGSLYQTRADLALTPDDAVYQPTLGRAMDAYEQALDADAQAPVAHWRLGLMALDADDFDTAIQHLSLAHNVLSPHRGVQKALGYAYLWQGQIEPAAALLRPLPEIPQELETWAWWRDSQGQETLADYAQQLHELLQAGQ